MDINESNNENKQAKLKWMKMAQDHKIFHFQLHPIPQRAQGPLGQNWAKSGMPGQALAILGYFLAKQVKLLTGPP